MSPIEAALEFIDKGGKEINLTDLGYGKLLGSGVVQGAWQVTVNAATPRAVEKIESAGGKIEVPKA